MLRASSLAPFPRAVGGSVFSEQSLTEEKSRRKESKASRFGHFLSLGAEEIDERNMAVPVGLGG